MASDWLWLCLALLISVYLASNSRWKRTRSRPPPGPTGIPVLGNILDSPKSGEPEAPFWVKHKDLYGPISSLSLLGQRLVILNDLQVCKDLLEKRSAKYSDRPTLQFAGKMIGWDQQMILSPYGDRFKHMRRLIYHFMGTKTSIEKFREAQRRETRWFLETALRDPKNLLKNIRKAQGSIFLTLSHGYTVEKERGHDPLIEVIEKAAREFHAATMPGAWLVDAFPFLRHIPSQIPFFSSFKKTAARFRQTNIQQVNIPHNFVKDQMKSGTAIPSFTSEQLDRGPDPYEEDVIKWAANSVYGGGTDTVVATLNTFFLTMILYPTAQRTAQEEIDRVIGRSRLPDFEDRKHLPYISALILEVMRWNVIGPMGIPHCTSTDDEYRGFFIPKGSIVLSNLWHVLTAISQDESFYPNPSEFMPERFMGESAQLDPRGFVFGFGRRACPGQGLAEANLYLTISTFLAVFTVTSPRSGPKPKASFIPGTVSHPEPFECDVQPRFPKSPSLIG